MFKAAIRVNKLSTIAQLRGASLHAQRHDETGKARVREDAEPGFGLAWSKAENDRDYLAAFKAHKAELGAGERKGSPLCLQAICVVSPEWVQKAGNLHDPENPHNRQLFDQAKAWAESWGGKGSVIATRLDLDEKGGAVVDVMVSPVRESRGKPVISTNKALQELKQATGERNEYSALQTSWADWCRDHLDAEILRGTRKEITQRQHLSPETYGAVLDKAREDLLRPVESVRVALQAAELSWEDTDLLRDYLLLRGEISRHRDDPRGYTPPEGDLDRHGVMVSLDDEPNTWKLIEAFRRGAQGILSTAYRFGMGWGRLIDEDGHEAGRAWFPALSDRLHLGAVIAKCGAFCAEAEAFVKNLRLEGSKHQLSPQQLWPEEATELVERYDRHLGLAAPQQIRPAHREQAFEVERSPEQDPPQRQQGRGRGGDRGL
ncbi:hypothetical protein ABEB22_21265 (plasmid) [Thioclava sp. 'Guangxiensis']|uniref:hypothetical protein n=1 Tax=Thioclava sp. 'Guangxiensis' TaxID=3149044 RepID=UPI0032C41530